MKDKIANFINIHKRNFITFAITNRQFMSFIILMVIETSLLGLTTLGPGVWGFETLFFDFSVIILLGSIGYLFKPKNQYAYFQTVLIVVTIIVTINSIYYTFYNSFVTVGLIESLGQVNTVTDAVLDKLTPLHGIYIFFPILFSMIHKSLKSHNYFNQNRKEQKEFWNIYARRNHPLMYQHHHFKRYGYKPTSQTVE